MADSIMHHWSPDEQFFAACWSSCEGPLHLVCLNKHSLAELEVGSCIILRQMIIIKCHALLLWES